MNSRPTFGLVYGKESRVSFLIRLFSAFRGEPPSVSNHAFCVRADGETIVESVPSGTRERRFRAAYDNDAYWGVLVAPRTMDADSLLSFDADLDRYLGMRYGFASIAKHFADGVLGWLAGADVYLVRRVRLPWREGAPRYNICSWLVCWTHKHAGFRFRGAAAALECERAAPDDLWDDVFQYRPQAFVVTAEFGRRPEDLPQNCAKRIDLDLSRITNR